ncbi:MAG: deoxyribonuclease IV [Mollicutes bacterium]|nr:deoxyribonuclease IV [Mollicutes bacterium]
MIIGSHVSYNGLLVSVETALSYGANTFMFYTGAPQNTVRKPIDEQVVKSAHKLMKENNIDINNIICHAPYIINLANKDKIDSWLFGIAFLKEEINRCENMGVKYIVIHPGSAVNHTKEDALNNIIEALNEVIDNDTKVTVLIETMAGKGTECGINLEEIKYIIENIIYKNKIGVCIDTCHLNDSGIDLDNFDTYLDDFDKLIGIDKLKCVHLNDSLNAIGARKDRHANIGYGTIGFDTLINIAYNKRLEKIPKILETPYIEDYPPYKFEIRQIKDKKFNPNLKNDVILYYLEQK